MEHRGSFYLSYRIRVIRGVLISLLLILLTAALVRGLLRGESVGLLWAALATLGAGELAVRRWIYAPFLTRERALRLIVEGGADEQEEGVALTCALSPAEEQMFQQMRQVIDPAQLFNLNKRQAQYLALQNQINPHFLYNTLESIRSEAMLAELDSVADMTEALATFFRYTISKVENLVTVEEELQNCETYFRIQQYRFGDRLSLDIQCDAEDRDELYRSRLPKLTLQPILENSIIHGTELKIGTGHLTIRLQRTQKRLLISVSDDGIGMEETVLEQLNNRLGKGGIVNSQGLSFLYLGYHYEELTQICDRTALFSNGRIVKILEHEWIGAPASFDNIVRRQLERHHDRAGLPPVLEAEELSGGTIDKLTFSVAPGECVVLQDLQNRIFRDLVGLFMGDVPIRAGVIRLGGVPYRPGQNRQIAVIGERPDRSMIFSQLSYLDNLGITLDHRLPELWLSRRVQWGLRQECERKLGAEVFDVPPGRLLTQQKYDLVYQRILLQNPKVVFCIQPFQGADMEMRIHIWKLLEQVLEKGIALVILAINLADSLSLASRLIRIRQDAPPETYEQSEFGRIPFSAPWLDLYRGPSPS